MKPKRRNRLHMLLSDDEAADLVAICDEHRCTTSDAVRMLIHKEVASWGQPEGDERWTDGRWQDPRWPKLWPKQIRRRNASERFYEAVAKRRTPEPAGDPPEEYVAEPAPQPAEPTPTKPRARARGRSRGGRSRG